MLISVHDSVPCANLLEQEFGLEMNKHIWPLLSLETKETRLLVLQWKTLHNIYPTNILLCKMKVRDGQMCSHCSDVIGYIECFFSDCMTIQTFKLLSTFGTIQLLLMFCWE